MLATLWPVADASTALLMQQFYRVGRGPEHSKAEALRQAQLSLLRGAKATLGSDGRRAGKLALPAATTSPPATTAEPIAPYAHPYFWAPFILMGNWL